MSKEYRCVCSKVFNKKFNLERHLNSNTCKSLCLPVDIKTQLDIYNIIEKHHVEKEKGINITNSNNNSNNVINININIPLSELTLKNTEESLYKMIEKYFEIQNIKNEQEFRNVPKVKFLISDYLKTNLCDQFKPELHCVKYVTKHPPSYNISQKRNDNGDIINTIQGLKDSVDLLSDPILKNIKQALQSFQKILIIENKKVSENREFDSLKYDYALYDTTIKALKNELNKKNVQAALKQFLKHDILNDINMKMKISVMEV